MKRVVCGITLLLVSVFVFWASASATCYAKEKIIFDNVDNRKLLLYERETYRVDIDRNALKKKRKIVWYTSNFNIAVISRNGKITARKPGKVKITAVVQGTKIKSAFQLRVKKFIKAKKVKISTKKKHVFVDDTLKLKAKMIPKKAGEELIWSSSNDEIATVDEDGEVTGNAPGKATIYVKSSKSNKIAKKKVVVRSNEIKSIRFKESKPVVGVSQTKELELKITPNYVTDKQLIWSSSDPSVATVDAGGRVTGIKEGYSVIRATWERDPSVSASCTLAVSKVQGMLTKEKLDKMNLQSVNNLMIVAHPDDETLFGGAHLISDNYLVVCLTNARTYRAEDFHDAMDIAKVERIMLSYPDTLELPDGKLQYDPDYNWDFDQLAIQNDIDLLLHYKQWDTVVTHNPDGDYGHYHHKKVSKYTTELYKKAPDQTKHFMYFGKYYKEEELTDAVKSTLQRTSPEIFDIKIKMLSAYKSKYWTCFIWLWHIQPYENWIPYENWV